VASTWGRAKVQIPPAPPLTLCKDTLFANDQPRWAPKLAGFFTFGLRTLALAPGPNFATFAPFRLSLLYSCGLAESKVRKITPISTNALREKCDKHCYVASVWRSATENEHRATSPRNRPHALSPVRSGAAVRFIMTPGRCCRCPSIPAPLAGSRRSVQCHLHPHPTRSGSSGLAPQRPKAVTQSSLPKATGRFAARCAKAVKAARRSRGR
jgi:hypothetical protein